MRHVLIADDEDRIRDVVQYALEREGYRVSVATDGQEALDRLALPDPVDLVVLDVMMPRVDGLEVCRRLRQSSSTPVLFLSAKSEEIDRIVGLELGGDDYLSKPFSPRELVARVKAILRRYGDVVPVEGEGATLSYGPIRIDRSRHEVTCNGEAIKLTATEFGALAALFERPGIVLSRKQLMDRAYAYDNHVTERTIDTHVRRIRAKFRPHSIDPIETVHGVGYKAANALDAS